MVRAGVVSHPSMWSFSGYNEIQAPRRKNVLIDYEKLRRLLGVGSYDQLRSSKGGLRNTWETGRRPGTRNGQAVSRWGGSRSFVETVKALLGFRGKGRAVIESSEGYQVRERPALYNDVFGTEKEDIGP
jgi:putative transposase